MALGLESAVIRGGKGGLSWALRRAALNLGSVESGVIVSSRLFFISKRIPFSRRMTVLNNCDSRIITCLTIALNLAGQFKFNAE